MIHYKVTTLGREGILQKVMTSGRDKILQSDIVKNCMSQSDNFK